MAETDLVPAGYLLTLVFVVAPTHKCRVVIMTWGFGRSERPPRAGGQVDHFGLPGGQLHHTGLQVVRMTTAATLGCQVVKPPGALGGQNVGT